MVIGDLGDLLPTGMSSVLCEHRTARLLLRGFQRQRTEERERRSPALALRRKQRRA
jgi:hypothetical protein